MVHCPECGKEQPDESKFCRYCGDRMPGGTEVRRLREEAARIAAAKGTTPPPAPGDAPAQQQPQASQAAVQSSAEQENEARFRTGQPLNRR